ncbi:2Fe-2S iron-sulfur cluster binding domain-containing protein, partial [Candidatus Bathyarchaeota archaeon]|nr:2Fe-2S iron-sulfur cluster binding domain-containing protein [Candidatus Bathyarchaeota archaeon]
MQEMGDLVKIFFDPMSKEIAVKRGALLLDAIREAGIRIESICGGKGDCGKCRVILNKGEVSRLSTKSEKFLSPQEISEGHRLACQIRVLGDSEFTIPVESLVASPKILISTEMMIDRLDPASKKYLVTLLPTRGDEQHSIKLEGYSGPTPKVSEEIYDNLLLMEHEQPITATLSRTNTPPEIVNIESGDRTSSNYGL